MVTSLGPEEATARQEVTGPTDPLRVVISHTLHPEARCVSFTVELLNRLTADIKTLVLRLVAYLKSLHVLAVCYAPTEINTVSAVSTLVWCHSSTMCNIYWHSGDCFGAHVFLDPWQKLGVTSSCLWCTTTLQLNSLICSLQQVQHRLQLPPALTSAHVSCSK